MPSRRPRPHGLRLLPILLLLPLSSCTYSKAVSDVIPASWIGYELGLEAPKVKTTTLEEPVGEQTETFDVAALSAAHLENGAFLNRGYPAPSPVTEPEGFEHWQMWGHDGYCFVQGFLAPVGTVHRLFEHECDTSSGHSGSPVYQWRVSLDQGWRPEIAGIVSHHAFGNNYARRIVGSDSFLSFAASLTLTSP